LFLFYKFMSNFIFMKKLHLLILFFVLVLGLRDPLSAQARLGLYYTSASSTTPNLNTQLSVFTQLKNLSTTDTFSGVVNFSLANKDSIITNLSVVGYPSFTGTSITLAPLEQRSALFTLQLLPSYFKIGPDIIIVWPVVSVAVIDSARAPIDIQAAVGVDDIADDSMQVFVANEHLFIRNSGIDQRLQQVQIIDIEGREIISRSAELKEHSLYLGDLPKGIYLIRIQIGEGLFRRIKFVR
jgi:hypothetical protein